MFLQQPPEGRYVGSPPFLFMDFVHAELCKISCNAPSLEGYEATNLISDYYNIRQRGFLAESFIIPPVSIVLQFVTPIDISHIIINTCVWPHKTCSLEILHGAGQLSECFHRVPRIAENNFRLLADIDVTQNEIYFTANSYAFRPVPIQLPLEAAEYMIQPCKNTIQLQINLTRTIGASIPALGQLEVWGHPSCRAPLHIREKLALVSLKQERASRAAMSRTLAFPQRQLHAAMSNRLGGQTDKPMLRPLSLQLPHNLATSEAYSCLMQSTNMIQPYPVSNVSLPNCHSHNTIQKNRTLLEKTSERSQRRTEKMKLGIPSSDARYTPHRYWRSLATSTITEPQVAQVGIAHTGSSVACTSAEAAISAQTLSKHKVQENSWLHLDTAGSFISAKHTYCRANVRTRQKSRLRKKRSLSAKKVTKSKRQTAKVKPGRGTKSSKSVAKSSKKLPRAIVPPSENPVSNSKAETTCAKRKPGPSGLRSKATNFVDEDVTIVFEKWYLKKKLKTSISKSPLEKSVVVISDNENDVPCLALECKETYKQEVLIVHTSSTEKLNLPFKAKILTGNTIDTKQNSTVVSKSPLEKSVVVISDNENDAAYTSLECKDKYKQEVLIIHTSNTEKLNLPFMSEILIGNTIDIEQNSTAVSKSPLEKSVVIISDNENDAACPSSECKDTYKQEVLIVHVSNTEKLNLPFKSEVLTGNAIDLEQNSTISKSPLEKSVVVISDNDAACPSLECKDKCKQEVLIVHTSNTEELNLPFKSEILTDNTIDIEQNSTIVSKSPLEKPVVVLSDNKNDAACLSLQCKDTHKQEVLSAHTSNTVKLNLPFKSEMVTGNTIDIEQNSTVVSKSPLEKSVVVLSDNKNYVACPSIQCKDTYKQEVLSAHTSNTVKLNLPFKSEILTGNAFDTEQNSTVVTYPVRSSMNHALNYSITRKHVATKKIPSLYPISGYRRKNISAGCDCLIPSNDHYDLPCGHRFCCACLLSKMNSNNEIKCSHCSRAFSNTQPVRVQL